MPPLPVRAALNDGSILKQLSARELAAIPIWKGNRILDEGHVQFIKNTIQSIKVLDMKPYHIVIYNEEDELGAIHEVSCIIDGQHRATVLRDYYNTHSPFEEGYHEFDIFVIEKRCASEQEIIEYFNILNAQKSIEWREDPIIAANRYLAALVKKFNVGRQTIIRLGKTRFPYISIDTLREAAVTHRIGFQMKDTPDEWAERIYLAHCVGLRELQNKECRTKEEDSALKAKCLLALGPFKTMQWMTQEQN
jgi:hypothetical protein